MYGNSSSKKTKSYYSGSHFSDYFTKLTATKGLFYVFVLFFVVSVGIVSVFAPFLIPAYCRIEKPGADPTGTQHDMGNNNNNNNNVTKLEFANPLFPYNPCQFKRIPYLMFLTPAECSYARRLMAAVFLGGIIGWERRSADRPAGIRTMSLVCLGSSLFTITSTFAFLDGPMSWDSSRISAAIPSGVGFLGAGLIFKQAEKDETSGETNHVVHGLTTSASVWVAAAVGVACGGEMYVAATFCVGVMVLLLRFGPRIRPGEDDDDDDSIGEDDDNNGQQELVGGGRAASKSYTSVDIACGDTSTDEQSQLLQRGPEKLTNSSRRTARPRPNLSTLV